MAARGAPLARDLAIVYALLIAYATLHPFTGWRDQGLSPFAWLAIWPKIFLSGDLTFNLLAYVPLGMLAVWALYGRVGAALSMLCAALAGVVLSGTLESLQSYLPTRTPSLADFAANGAGALAGALLGALLAPGLLQRGLLKKISDDWIDRRAPRALILVALWLFASLYPQSMLFGHGSLLGLIGPVSGYPFTPAEFTRVEAAVTATSLFAAGALLAGSVRAPGPRIVLLILFIAASCGVRALSHAILFSPELAFAWLTPGAQRGLMFGTGALLLVLALPRTMQLALVAVALTFAAVVVNLAPANPYYASIVQVLNPGRFLNFNGLTQTIASAWPFLALVYVLFALGTARGGRT